MRVEAFIQARMGSSRLPGKVLKKVLNRPLLDFLVERVKDCQEIDNIVILTTYLEEDDLIASFCEDKKLCCFRGSKENVLERYYQASLKNNPNGIVRITADCPLIDPEVVDQVVKAFRHQYPKIDYVSNCLERTFPRGLDVEVFSHEALHRAYQNGHRPDEKEHVTVYIYRHPDLFKLLNVSHIQSLSSYRWTVDTPEDFELIRLILEHLYVHKPHFRLNDILTLLSYHPEWNKINAHIEQKKLS